MSKSALTYDCGDEDDAEMTEDNVRSTSPKQAQV